MLSLWTGLITSTILGQIIVCAQGIISLWLLTLLIKKYKQVNYAIKYSKRFQHDFATEINSMDIYLKRRNSRDIPMENIYIAACDRLLNLLSPRNRIDVINKTESHALSEKEFKLVRSSCERALEKEVIRIESNLDVTGTLITLSPMLGLLGTVWGVLEAFSDLGTSNSADLTTLAPSISSALVTTVVGLLIAIPSQFAFTNLNEKVRALNADLDTFSYELIGRIANEYQGKAEY